MAAVWAMRQTHLQVPHLRKPLATRWLFALLELKSGLPAGEAGMVAYKRFDASMGSRVDLQVSLL